ncbi:hypothetical protein HY480_03240 [Candidatus Uhrbacteria bacterium]|nr:hypothetical protein [Candidatus Uhrbacteria bacterium]
MDDFSGAVDRAIADAERVIRASEYRSETLGVHLSNLLACLRHARGIAGAAASQNPKSAIAAIHTLADALASCAEALEDDLTQRSSECTMLRAERATFEEERTQLERFVTELQQQLHDAESVALTTSDDVIRRLTAYLQPLPGRVDDVISRTATRIAALERLRANDVHAIHAFEEITVRATTVTSTALVTRSLEEEIRALSVDVAPFRGRRFYELTDADRSALDDVVARYEAVHTQYRELIGLIDTLDHELRDAKTDLDALGITWADIDRRLRHATDVFPILITCDCFALVGTSEEEVARKRGVHRSLREQAGMLLTAIERELYGYRTRYEATDAALTAIHDEVRRLGEFTDTSWLDELDHGLQEIIRGTVLAFRTDHDRSLSRRVLHGTLTTAALLAVDAPETTVDDALRPELFAVAGTSALHARMHLFRLTEAGRYWHDRWRRNHPELAERVAAARTAWEANRERERATDREQRARRQEDRAHRSAAHAAAAEAERIARAHPANIIRELQPADVQVLNAFTALDALYRDTDMVKFLAAAVTAGIIAKRYLTDIPGAITRLLSADPALLLMPNGSTEARGGHAVRTDAARRLESFLPTLTDLEEKRLAVRQLLEVKVKHWSPDASACYHRLRTAFFPTT